MIRKLLGLVLFAASVGTISAQSCADISVIRIAETMLDPNGANDFDTDNNGTASGVDEFIKICNTGSTSFPLLGYALNDNNGTYYTFTADDVLAAGRCFTIVNFYESRPLPDGVIDAARPGNNPVLRNGGEDMKFEVLSTGVTCPAVVVSQSEDGCPSLPDGTNVGGSCISRDDYDFGAPSANSPLPVTLLSYGVETTATGNRITWTTASEINNAYFEVLHSTDAQNWTGVTTIDGAGNSTDVNSYDYLHATATAKVNYYKISQTDFDGTTTTTDVLVANGQPSANKLSYGPNPTNGNFTVQGLKDRTFEIVDVNGRLIKRGDATHASVNLGSAPAGTYYLRIIGAEGVETHKFIKQ